MKLGSEPCVPWEHLIACQICGSTGHTHTPSSQEATSPATNVTVAATWLKPSHWSTVKDGSWPAFSSLRLIGIIYNLAKDEIKCYYRLLTHISAHSCEIFTSARYEMKEKCFKVNSLANQWRKHPAGHAAPGEFSWMLRRRSRHGSKIRRRAEQNKRVKVKHTGQKTVTWTAY